MLANPVSYDASGAELLSDEDVDSLAGDAGMPWSSIALAAARATVVRQPALGDHPQVLGEPDVCHPDLGIAFHGERVQPRGARGLANRPPPAYPAPRAGPGQVGQPH